MSRTFRFSLGALTILGVPVLLYFAGVNFLFSWIGASLGLLFSLVYLVFLLWLLSRSPMWPDSAGAGWRWVVASLIWGGGVSFLLVMVGGIPLLTLTDRLGIIMFAASFGGAWPEEIAKFLGVGVMLFSFRGLNRPWHGLMTGAVIGLGFEVSENLMYGAAGALLDPNTDVVGALQTWGVRLVVGPGLHIVLSALAGWGLGLAVFTAARSDAWRFRVAATWFLVAFGLHFVWNILWPEEWMLLLHYGVITVVLYPLFAWVWMRAHRMARADDTYAFTPGVERALT